jgi:hypothetical protein
MPKRRLAKKNQNYIEKKYKKSSGRGYENETLK